MSLEPNPYGSPTAELRSLTFRDVECDPAAFLQRLGVYLAAGLCTFGALCLPLHYFYELFVPVDPHWTSLCLGSLLVSTVVTGALLDRPIRQVDPASFMAWMFVALNGVLFGLLLTLAATLSQPSWGPLGLTFIPAGGVLGVVGSVLTAHLTVPVAWCAIHVARRCGVRRRDVAGL